MQAIYNELKAPFEKEAYGIDKSRGTNNQFTSIGAQYIIDRLNTVLGLGRWELTGNYELGKDESGKVVYAIYYGNLDVRIHTKDGDSTVISEIHIENVGYSEQKMVEDKYAKIKGTMRPSRLIGDMLKSAKTDCLSKCSSYLGIGDDVFKGKVKPGSAPVQPQPVIDPVKNQLIGDILALVKSVTCSDDEYREFMHTQLEAKSKADLLAMSTEKLRDKKLAIELIAQVQK